jgi:hypothetical protein
MRRKIIVSENENEILKKDLVLAREDIINAEEKVGHLHKNKEKLTELLKQKLLEAERAISVRFESEKTALKAAKMTQIRDFDKNLEEARLEQVGIYILNVYFLQHVCRQSTNLGNNLISVMPSLIPVT